MTNSARGDIDYSLRVFKSSDIGPFLRAFRWHEAKHLPVLQADDDPTRVIQGRPPFDHSGRKWLSPEVRAVLVVDGGQKSGLGVARARLTGSQQHVGADDEAVEPAPRLVLPEGLWRSLPARRLIPTRGRLLDFRRPGRKRRQQRQRRLPAPFIAHVVNERFAVGGRGGGR